MLRGERGGRLSTNSKVTIGVEPSMSLNNVTAGSSRVSRLRKKRRRISRSSSVRAIFALQAERGRTSRVRGQ